MTDTKKLLCALQTAACASEFLDSRLRRDLVDRRARVLRRIAVHLHELRQVEFRLLQDLDLPDEDVLQGVDGLAPLLNLLWDRLRHRDTVVDTEEKERHKVGVRTSGKTHGKRMGQEGGK